MPWWVALDCFLLPGLLHCTLKYNLTVNIFDRDLSEWVKIHMNKINSLATFSPKFIILTSKTKSPLKKGSNQSRNIRFIFSF